MNRKSQTSVSKRSVKIVNKSVTNSLLNSVSKRTSLYPSTVGSHHPQDLMIATKDKRQMTKLSNIKKLISRQKVQGTSQVVNPKIKYLNQASGEGLPQLNVASSHQLVSMPTKHHNTSSVDPAILQQSAQYLPKMEPVVKSPIKVSETRIMASNEKMKPGVMYDVYSDNSS